MTGFSLLLDPVFVRVSDTSVLINFVLGPLQGDRIFFFNFSI